MIMISGAYLKLECRRSWLKKKWIVYLSSSVISLAILSLYANAGSVPASLKEKNTIKSKVNGYYLEPFEFRYNSETNVLSVFVPFALENPLKKSVLIEADSNTFYLAVGKDEDEYIEEWDFSGVGFRKHGTDDVAKWIAIDPGKTTVVGGEFDMSVAKEQLCDMIYMVRNTDDDIDTNIYGKYDVSFRVESEDVKLDRLLSLDELVFLYDGIETNVLVGETEKYNKVGQESQSSAVFVCAE